MGFRHVYPTKGKMLFDGGLNTKFEKSLIPDNESPDCLNVVFENGSVGTRQGVSKVNTGSVGSFVCDGIFTRRARDGSESMCAYFGGHFYTLQGTSFITVPSAQSLFTAGVRFGHAKMENYLFTGNGGQISYKWNGTEFTRHGVYPPTTTSTVASQAIGVLTGDYRYKVTAVNSNLVESDVGPVTTTFAAVGATLRVSSIPTFAVSYGVNARKLYRTATSGTVFKLVTTINDNTTTTYDDNNADSALTTTAPTDNGVPPKYNVICYHQSRLFMNDIGTPNQIWYTNLDNPYTVASTNFQIVGDDTSDLVKAIAPYNNSIIIYCERSIWMIYMQDTDPDNWALVKISDSYGCSAPYSVIGYQDKQLFAANDSSGKFVGFGSIRGNAVDPDVINLSISSAGSDLKTDRIEPDMFDVQTLYLGNITAITHKNKAWITLTKGSGNTTNNRVYQMDYSISNLTKSQKESWSPFTGINAAQFTIYGGNIYYGSSTANGFVYKAESGSYNDDGSAINSYFYTKEFGGDDPDLNMHKDFRYCHFLIDLAGSYFMNIGYKVDSEIGDGNQDQVDLNPGGSLWGSMVWGVDNWGGGSTQRDIRFYLGTSRGKRIQLKFSNQNTVNQRFKVHYGSMYYNVKGVR